MPGHPVPGPASLCPQLPFAELLHDPCPLSWGAPLRGPCSAQERPREEEKKVPEVLQGYVLGKGSQGKLRLQSVLRGGIYAWHPGKED